MFNDSDLVRWNGDKRYLLELRERGVAIVPSQIGAGAGLREVVTGLNGQEIVIKPTVGAGATHTIRGIAGSPELDQAIDELPDTVYLVQPFQPEVQTDGEWSLVFIDGEFSHAVVQRPVAGDYRVQLMFGGVATPADPPAAVLESARTVLTTAGVHPLYARVDGLVVNGRFLLMELELIEPYLFFPQSPEAAQKLASAVAARI